MAIPITYRNSKCCQYEFSLVFNPVLISRSVLWALPYEPRRMFDLIFVEGLKSYWTNSCKDI